MLQFYKKKETYFSDQVNNQSLELTNKVLTQLCSILRSMTPFSPKRRGKPEPPLARTYEMQICHHRSSKCTNFANTEASQTLSFEHKTLDAPDGGRALIVIAAGAYLMFYGLSILLPFGVPLWTHPRRMCGCIKLH